MQCLFCKRTGAVPCTWLAWKLRRATVSELRPGDTIRVYEQTIVVREIRPIPVNEIPAWSHGPLVRVWYQLNGSRKYWVGAPAALVMRFERHRCEQAACEIHVRDVGGNHRYCREHWDSWTEIGEEQAA